MKRKSIFVVVMIAVCVGLVGTVAAQPNAPDVAVGTAFTYQGQIKRNGALFTGTCDLQFKLWDAAAAGTQQGSMLSMNAVNVNNGVFAVQLDFGAQFKGEARWLQTEARCANDAGYEALPRVALNASPYAIGLMPGTIVNGNMPYATGDATFKATNASASVGTAFTYQGRLTDGDVPANGTYDFDFILYDLPSAGNVIGTANIRNDVTVTNGLFVASLDFGTSAFNGQARYLQIWVRPGSSTGGYTPLSPRQEMTATPYALFSEAPWATNGITISYTGGNVGIGTTTPSAALSIVKSSAAEPTAYGAPIGLKVGTPSGTIPFAVRQNVGESSTPGLALFETSDGNLGGLGANLNTFIVSGASSKGLGFNVNNTTRAMTIDTSGNVGIGTSSPQRTLHVSSANSGLRLQSSNPQVWTTTEYKTDAREWHTGVGGSGVLNGVANSYYIADATAGVFRLFIDYLGNVAIGTVNPCGGARLYVYKGVSAPSGCSTAAVFGASENDPGVSGDSLTNIGVYATSRDSEGLRAWSMNGTAIRGDDNSGTYIFEGWDTNSVSNRRFAVVRATGNVLADGAYTGPADFAEMMPASQSKADYTPGDVLVIGADGKLTRSDKPNATNLAGVYSAKPGFLGDTEIAAHGIESYDSPQAQERIAVALLGIVPVKVTDENGPIRPGDLLTTSSTPGHAMKAKPVVVSGIEIYPTGTILGKALESWEQGNGMIQVLITLR